MHISYKLSGAKIDDFSLKSSIQYDSVKETKLDSMSAAEAVSKAMSCYDLLLATSSIVFPGEEKFHYELQEHHQRKRQSVSTNALKRFVKFLVGTSEDKTRSEITSSREFERLCCCALAPTNPVQNTLTCSIQTYFQALSALGSLCPIPSKIKTESIIPFLERIKVFIKVDELAPYDITAVECACRRLELPPESFSFISNAYKALQLPFHITCGFANNLVSIHDIRKEVKFNADILTTRDGRRVQERRETCWMADSGVGGLAYSGKIMAPVPFTSTVAIVRDSLYDRTGIYYDCCLLNWYEDGEAACKFHSDPDHGRLWSVDTAIISIGETRRFNLRKISTNGGSSDSSESEHFSYHVINGDCFHMFGDCQDTFQHCVMKSEGPTNNSPRASLVFKKSLPGVGGRRGHGIASTAASLGVPKRNFNEKSRNKGPPGGTKSVVGKKRVQKGLS